MVINLLFTKITERGEKGKREKKGILSISTIVDELCVKNKSAGFNPEPNWSLSNQAMGRLVQTVDFFTKLKIQIKNRNWWFNLPNNKLKTKSSTGLQIKKVYFCMLFSLLVFFVYMRMPIYTCATIQRSTRHLAKQFSNIFANSRKPMV